MPVPDYTRERDVAIEAAEAAAVHIRAHAGGLTRGALAADALRAKGTHDLVTFVDEAAERAIVDVLRAAFPADAVLAEEGTGAEPDGAGAASAPARRRWIVDPLDGTTNFAHGVPPYAVSIALEDEGELAVAVVLDVALGERFVAVRGGGLTCNGAPAGVSATDALGDALVATGFPFRDYRYVGGYLAAFEGVIRATRGVRRHGAASVDLAWVACGRFDGFFEAGLAPWDTAAGVLLVREGGGAVSALPDGADPVHGGGLVATNGRLHGALAEAVAPLGTAYGATKSAMKSDAGG